MQVFERLRHALSGQRVDIDRLRVLEKLVDIGRRDGVLGELPFQPAQTECREHQKPRNTGHQQP